MMKSEFVSLIKSSCEDALVASGFRRLRRHEVALDISSDFLGWVGLNIGNYATHVRVNPFVGVHCIPVMHMIANLQARKYQVGSVATYAVHLGELCPTLHVFDFGPESDVSGEASRLAAAIAEHGAPYMRSLANFDVLLPLLKDRVKSLGGFPERYAAALRLTGQHEHAREFVDLCRREYSAGEPVVRESFDRFAIPFLAQPLPGPSSN